MSNQNSHQIEQTPMPEIVAGARVYLRRYTDTDAHVLHLTLQSAYQHLRPWLPGFEQPRSFEQVRTSIQQSQTRWSQRESFTMGLWTRETERFLGEVRLRPTAWCVPAFDLSFWLQPAAQGQGYASETVQLLTTLAFETLHASRVAIACEPRNQRSRRVAERLGFVQEGHFRNTDCGPDGLPCDLLIFALIPDDYVRVRPMWPGH